MTSGKSIPGKFGKPYLALQQRPLPPDSAGKRFCDQIRGYCLYIRPKMIGSIISLLTSRLEPDSELHDARALLSIAAAYMARHKLYMARNKLYTDRNHARNLEDLQAATVLLLEVAHGTSDGHADKAMVHDLVAMAHVELYALDASEDASNLATAAEHFSVAIRLEPDREYQAQGFHFIASIRHGLYKKTGNVTFLDECTTDSRLALDRTPKGDPKWRLRSELVIKAQATKIEKLRDIEGIADIADVKLAMKHGLDILEYQPGGVDLSHEQLAELWSAFSSAGVRHYDPEILGKATSLFDDLLDKMDVGHPFRAEALCQHGKVYEARYKVEKDVRFLEAAARQAKEALELTPRADKIWKPHLFRAAMMWYYLFCESPSFESLETADGLWEEVVPFLDEESQEYYKVLIARAMLSYNRIFHIPKAASAATAIRRVEDVLQKVPLEKRGGTNFDNLLKEMVRIHGAMQEAESSAQQSRDVASIAPPGLPHDWETRPDKSEILDQLLSNMSSSWYMTELKKELDRAKAQLPRDSWSTREEQKFGPAQMTILQGMADWQQYYSKWTAFNLKRLRFKSYEEAKRPETRVELDNLLESAIQSLEKTLAPGIPEPLRLLGLFEDLSTGYRHRWARTRDEADLDRAIQMLNMGLGKVSADNAHKASLLHDIGCVYLDKYDARGALTDLEAGVQHVKQATKSQLVLAGLLKVSSPPLLTVTELKAVLHDVDICAGTHGPNLVKYLGSLVKALFVLYRRTRDRTDLAQASFLALAVTGARFRHNTEAKLCLFPALALGLVEQFRITRDLAHADYPSHFLVEVMKMADVLRDGKAFIRHALLLGQLHRDRYTISKDTNDLDLELLRLQAAIKRADDDDEYRALILERLGRAFKDRHGRTGDEEDLQKAVGYLQKSLSYDKDWPVEGTITGKELFGIYTSQGDWRRACDVASAIFARVQRTIGWELESRDKQALLRQYAGLASDAAAAAVLSGESAFTALRYLETGRGVIASSLLGLRSELDDLERDHPELAQQYVKARSQIDYIKRAPRNEAAQWLPVNQPTYRYQATKSLEGVLETIRSLPGYGSFLKAMPEEQMRAAATAAGGPIVIINVSLYCCHAIIIREEDGITNHLLPNLKMEEIQSRAQKNSVHSMTSDELEWLWNKIVCPILDILGYTNVPLSTDDSAWRRVWWIPTGPLARLPLHAAGYHNDTTSDGGRTALDRVISSYSLSVRALVQSQASLSKAETTSFSSLSSHKHTKPEVAVLLGMDDLKNAPQETKKVAEICRDMLVKWPEAQTDPLLRALRTADIFHFAGHGESDAQDPLKSALILRGEDRLTVSNLFELNLHERHPFLAFLSACSTGKIRQDDALDEGLHLISACQVAGFRHVIGTLWEVNDSSCVDVAKIVYKWMHLRGLGHASVSESLHFACRRLRDDWARGEKEKKAQQKEREDAARGQDRDMRALAPMEDDRPLFWVPYVHYGV